MNDRFAIGGKLSKPREHAQLLVVGAGAAGVAAAIEGAQAGLSVVLVDENPVSAGLMGLDVPLFYGQRMTAAVQEEGRMVERIVASSPALEAAYDAGVDVRLGVTVWGAFVNGPAVRALPGRVAGLADADTSWLCGFDALILATGARDLVLGFAGVDTPGVMGVRALDALLSRYDAFSGRRIVFLGSGNLAAAAALRAIGRGIEVAALVEVLPEPQAAPALIDALAAHGVRVLTSHVILRAEAAGGDVAAAIVAPIQDTGAAERLACDTICLAIGVSPAIELADVAGCKLVARGAEGGAVARAVGVAGTSIPGVFMAGDCAGVIDPAADISVAEASGRGAARAAIAWLAGESLDETPAAAGAAAGDAYVYRMAWMRALVESGGMSAPVCLCEEVSRADLLGVQPPRYLGCDSRQMAARSAETLLQDGPLNPDQIKRLTRAGMGPCQGRRCRDQVALLLAMASNGSPQDVPLASHRAPVRPLPLRVLAADDESVEMRDLWDVWFGIPTQWVPYDDIGTEREAEILSAHGGGNMHL
jgi:thioredoxin reductase